MDVDFDDTGDSKRFRTEDSSKSCSSADSISTTSRFSCSFCSYTSENQADLDFHHHIHHQHLCSQCKKFFPSYFLLDIHVDEMHNSYSRLSSYRCLIESCSKTFNNLDQRLTHMSNEHSIKDRQMNDLLLLFENQKINSNDSSKQKFGYDSEKTFVHHRRLQPRTFPQSSHWDPEDD